jgi:hypothetical protein
VDPNAKEHTDCVLEANAKKLVRDEMYNIRLQATNAYLKSQVVQINSFLEYSDTFLTADQYTLVNDS